MIELHIRHVADLGRLLHTHTLLGALFMVISEKGAALPSCNKSYHDVLAKSKAKQQIITPEVLPPRCLAESTRTLPCAVPIHYPDRFPSRSVRTAPPKTGYPAARGPQPGSRAAKHVLLPPLPVTASLLLLSRPLLPRPLALPLRMLLKLHRLYWCRLKQSYSVLQWKQVRNQVAGRHLPKPLQRPQRLPTLRIEE